MLECPKCKSKNINQFRMPTGEIWCGDCGLREYNKEKYNPFIKETDFDKFLKLFGSVGVKHKIDQTNENLDYIIVWDGSKTMLLNFIFSKSGNYEYQDYWGY